MTLLLAMVLMMAHPTHVYEITFDSVHTEQEVRQILLNFTVLQLKHPGVASKQKKWDVVIQDRGTKTAVRTKLRSLHGITRVASTD